MDTTSDHTIHFCIMGGTIDSYYDGVADTVVVRPASIIPRYIEAFKLRSKTIFSEICMKDSREVNEHDRKALGGYWQTVPRRK